MTHSMMLLYKYCPFNVFCCVTFGIIYERKCTLRLEIFMNLVVAMDGKHALMQAPERSVSLLNMRKLQVISYWLSYMLSIGLLL